MDADGLRRLGRSALPIVAILSLAFGVGASIAFARDTLGFDFLAYHQAAQRLLAGQPLYDMSYTQTGGFGLFYYPPTFAPLLLPFGALTASTATLLWIALSVAAFLVGALAMPVPMSVRWWTILLGGWSFPLVYAMKLGQVGPVLFCLMALGWRWLDREVPLGVVSAIGAAIKLQPGVILVWALLTGRLRALVAGAIALIAIGLAATLLAGTQSWADFVTLIGTVSDPIRTEHNFTPGAVAYASGVPAEVASGLQLASTLAALVLVIVAARTGTDESSYMVAVIASQLLSPILWDHYAMLLLLPVAFLLAAGRWWAVVIPIATAWPLIGLVPPVIYPLAFWLTLIAVVLVGRAAMDPRESLGEALAR